MTRLSRNLADRPTARPSQVTRPSAAEALAGSTPPSADFPRTVTPSASGAPRAVPTTPVAVRGGGVVSKRRAKPVRLTMPASARWDAGVWTVVLPIVAVSELNAHTHWRVRHTRSVRQHETVAHSLARLVGATGADLLAAHGAITVTLTRIAPRALDQGDNANSSLKHVRDAVAKWLGLPTNKRGHARDDDPSVTWAYAQRRDKPRTYGVEIRFEARTEGGL